MGLTFREASIYAKAKKFKLTPKGLQKGRQKRTKVAMVLPFSLGDLPDGILVTMAKSPKVAKTAVRVKVEAGGQSPAATYYAHLLKLKGKGYVTVVK